MTVVTFEDYTPIPRFDGTPWSGITIQEAATPDGPWTNIDTQALSPLDSDPRSPASRSFTTDNATLSAGWYLITFTDSIGNQLPTVPVQNVPPEQGDWYPSVKQVANKILSRTRNSVGQLAGTFNASTEPTDTQTRSIIGDVITEVADVIGDEIPPELWDDAQNVVALRAAMQIELDFYSDQVNTGRSIYPQLKEQYERALESLAGAVSRAQEGDGSVTSAGAGTEPKYDFPDPGIGFNTVW